MITALKILAVLAGAILGGAAMFAGIVWGFEHPQDMMAILLGIFVVDMVLIAAALVAVIVAGMLGWVSRE